MTEKKTSLWAKILLFSVIVLVLMSIISDVLELGDRLSNIHPALSIVAYVLVALVVLVGVIYPIFGVFTAPIFSLDKLHTEDGKARQKWCKRLVNNLIRNTELTDEERLEVIGYLNCEDETDDKLIEFFDRKIRPEINKEIKDSAKKVLVVTAVSQNSLYDMLGMASTNFWLVKRIVEICGFRPTTPQVVRLYIRILSYTFLAGTIEDLDIQEWMPHAMENSLGKVSGLVLASLTQGAINALNTLRIASITKNYLLNANVRLSRKELRKKSYLEASSILKDIVKSNFDDKVTTPIKNLFSRKSDDSDNRPTAQ